MFRRRRVTEYDAAPPPRPVLWPWLALLLVLVSGGLAAGYFLTRDDGGSATKTQVPNVVGFSTSVAIQRLGQRGYPAIVKGRVSSGARLGAVLSQQPVAGTELTRGKQVTITIARGPSTIEVPNVVGLSDDQAFTRLLAAGLQGRAVQVDSSQTKGRVVKQTPSVGAEATKGSTVTLSVSKGSAPSTVPKVTGQTETKATAMLIRLGFRVSISRVPATQPKGRVFSQQPAPGARAQKGSIVAINVSTGPSPKVPPAVTSTAPVN